MRIRAIVVVGLLTAGMLTLLAGPASAHEDRTIGTFEVAVGFAEEPAYAGQPNAVQLFLNDDRGNAVTDLTDELRVTVTFNGQTSEPFTFEPAFEIGEFGTPGDYRADLVPSQPGTYSISLSGTFEGVDFEGKPFVSGPKTFGDVQDIAAASFPQVTAPSNQELATRIDQESTRTGDAVRAASTSAGAADDAAASARTFGIVGIVVGALGLVVALVAFGATRKARG
jgi:hypothetical protein